MALIGLAGAAGSGKTTAGRYLFGARFHAMAFADPIKHALAEAFAIDASAFDGPAKERPIDWLNDLSPRRLMQLFGTDFARERIRRDIWLRVAERRLDAHLRYRHPGGDADVVFTDVRFNNEAEWILGRGGSVVRLVRRRASPVADHVSEHGIADHLVTYTVPNDDTVETLYARLDDIVRLVRHG